MSNIINTKVKFVRNLKNFNFDPNISGAEQKKVLKECCDAAEQCGIKCAALKDINEDTIKSMIDRGIVERGFVDEYENQACGNNTNVTIQINGKNHIEIFSVNTNIYDAYKEAKQIDKQLCNKLNFAYNDNFGFLAPDIKDIGSGMSVHVWLMLPAVAKIYSISKLPKINDKLVFEIDNIDSQSGLTRVCTTAALGYTEKQICELASAYIDKLVKLEIETASKLAAEDKDEILDSSCRAKAILKNCIKISAAEAYKLLGDILIGINSGIENEISSQQINDVLNIINIYENDFKRLAKNIQKKLNNKK